MRIKVDKKRWELKKSVYREAKELVLNPGCGWYHVYAFKVEKQPDFEELKWCLYQEETFALLVLDIGKYANDLIAEEALKHIHAILCFFSKEKKDMILRFVYDMEGKGIEKEPMSQKQIEKHMKQIGTLLREFQDDVYMVQGLLLGSWGEMHNSKFLGEESLKHLAQIYRKAVGESTFMAVRTPMQWRSIYTSKEFEKERERMGLFNDALFSSKTDMGTYAEEEMKQSEWTKAWGREKELEFQEQLCTSVPNGGEALGEACYSDMDTAVKLCYRMHLSYLNSTYDSRVLDKWKSSEYQGMNGYDYIGIHLGYRFIIRDTSLCGKKKQELQIVIENAGFANLYEEAEVMLILKEPAQKNVKVIKIAADPRGWNSTEKITLRVELELLSIGNYELFLEMIRKKDGRTICFANEDAKQGVYLGLLCNR